MSLTVVVAALLEPFETVGDISRDALAHRSGSSHKESLFEILERYLILSVCSIDQLRVHTLGW